MLSKFILSLHNYMSIVESKIHDPSSIIFKFNQLYQFVDLYYRLLLHISYISEDKITAFEELIDWCDENLLNLMFKKQKKSKEDDEVIEFVCKLYNCLSTLICDSSISDLARFQQETMLKFFKSGINYLNKFSDTKLETIKDSLCLIAQCNLKIIFYSYQMNKEIDVNQIKEFILILMNKLPDNEFTQTIKINEVMTLLSKKPEYGSIKKEIEENIITSFEISDRDKLSSENEDLPLKTRYLLGTLVNIEGTETNSNLRL